MFQSWAMKRMTESSGRVVCVCVCVCVRALTHARTCASACVFETGRGKESWRETEQSVPSLFSFIWRTPRILPSPLSRSEALFLSFLFSLSHGLLCFSICVPIPFSLTLPLSLSLSLPLPLSLSLSLSFSFSFSLSMYLFANLKLQVLVHWSCCSCLVTITTCEWGDTGGVCVIITEAWTLERASLSSLSLSLLSLSSLSLSLLSLSLSSLSSLSLSLSLLSLLSLFSHYLTLTLSLSLTPSLSVFREYGAMYPNKNMMISLSKVLDNSPIVYRVTKHIVG